MYKSNEVLKTMTENELENLKGELQSYINRVEYQIEEYRECSDCGKRLFEGYCEGNGYNYYCDDCISNHYTDEEIQKAYDEDTLYRTEWD